MVQVTLCLYGHSTTDVFSVSLEINGKLLTGLKLGKTSSRSSSFRRGLTRAFSIPQGSIQLEGICLLKVLIWAEDNRGIPSRAMLALGHCCIVLGDSLISFLTSSSERGWKERNISSYFTGTPGFMIRSGSWLSHFVLIIWMFIIKKSPKCVRQIF